MRKPVNLKEMFGDRYKIALNEAALRDTGDPWYYQIPCQFGHFYPLPAERIGFFCDSVVILNRLHKEHPELECDICDGEAIFYFTPDQFDMVAECAKPKKKRRILAEQMQRLSKVGQQTRFVSQPG